MVINLDNASAETVERVDLFVLNGKTYSMPKTVGANVGLKYTRIARDQGEAAATIYAAEAILGKEAWTALEEDDNLTQEQLEQIFSLVNEVMVGKESAPFETSE